MVDRLYFMGKEELEKAVNKDFVSLLKRANLTVECATPRRLLDATRELFHMLFNTDMECLIVKIETCTGKQIDINIISKIASDKDYELRFMAAWEEVDGTNAYRLVWFRLCNTNACIRFDHRGGRIISYLPPGRDLSDIY